MRISPDSSSIFHAYAKLVLRINILVTASQRAIVQGIGSSRPKLLGQFRLVIDGLAPAGDRGAQLEGAAKLDHGAVIRFECSLAPSSGGRAVASIDDTEVRAPGDCDRVSARCSFLQASHASSIGAKLPRVPSTGSCRAMYSSFWGDG